MRVISREDLCLEHPDYTDEQIDEALRQIIEEAIRRDHAEYAAAEDELRAGRLGGTLCACCDKPLPAGSLGPDCAACAELTA